MNSLLFALLCLVFTSACLAKDVRIVGGTNTDITEYPYSASFRLLKERRLFCAGAIITERHILTSAHCFDDLRITRVGAYVGTSSSLDYSVLYYKICYVEVHPKYSNSNDMGKKARYDIAVVAVEPSIAFNRFRHKVDLPTHDSKPGETGIITGWGRTGFPKGDMSNVIQKASMTIVTNAECAKYIPFKIYSEQICAFQKQGVGACHGDSGAPLVIDGKVVGISSFVRPCATGEPDVYARVFSLIDFIRDSISHQHKPWPSCTVS